MGERLLGVGVQQPAGRDQVPRDRVGGVLRQRPQLTANLAVQLARVDVLGRQQALLGAPAQLTIGQRRTVGTGLALRAALTAGRAAGGGTPGRGARTRPRRRTVPLVTLPATLTAAGTGTGRAPLVPVASGATVTRTAGTWTVGALAVPRARTGAVVRRRTGTGLRRPVTPARAVVARRTRAGPRRPILPAPAIATGGAGAVVARRTGTGLRRPVTPARPVLTRRSGAGRVGAPVVPGGVPAGRAGTGPVGATTPEPGSLAPTAGAARPAGALGAGRC